MTLADLGLTWDDLATAGLYLLGVGVFARLLREVFEL